MGLKVSEATERIGKQAARAISDIEAQRDGLVSSGSPDARDNLLALAEALKAQADAAKAAADDLK